MFLIAPSCDILKKALIANVLAAICNENKMQSIILDLSIAATEAFWSVYKDGVKYVEDIIPVLSGISSKTLKKYLSPMEESLVLGLKESSFDDMNFEKISYLIDVLEENYKYVFVIVPNENKDNTFNLVKKAKICLLPYLSDSLSARNALILADLYLSKCGSEAEIIPLRLDLGYDFHSEQILKKHSVFAKQFTAIFNPKVQEKVMYPENVYKDNSDSLTLSLRETIKLYDCKEKRHDSQESADNYFRNEEVYKELAGNVHKELVDEMKNYADETDNQKVKETAKSKINDILKKMDLKLPIDISQRLIKELCDDVAGLGVLEDFISNSEITEIMVNGINNIYVEKSGKIIESQSAFPNEQNLKTVIERIVSQTGRHIDEASPIVDARLKDGSRVNAVIRPVALNGPALTIRKFLKNKLSVESLVDAGALSKEMAEFLKAAVILKKNIIISGGTGTGKTTLLNAVSSFIPPNERLVTIEDSAELQLQQKHTIRLEGRPKSSEGTGEISIRRLVINALRMRPDRIIVGECRSGEALDMLQAMNTGHEGSMSTIHSNSEKDAIGRLQTMVLMSGAELPAEAIISQIISAVNIIVQLTRYFDGSRKVSSISVIEQTDEEPKYKIEKIFEFKLSGIKDSKQQGAFKGNGIIPSFIETAALRGINIKKEIFQ